MNNLDKECTSEILTFIKDKLKQGYVIEQTNPENVQLILRKGAHRLVPTTKEAKELLLSLSIEEQENKVKEGLLFLSKVKQESVYT